MKTVMKAKRCVTIAGLSICLFFKGMSGNWQVVPSIDSVSSIDTASSLLTEPGEVLGDLSGTGQRHPHSVFVEIGGGGLVYAIGYEYLFLKHFNVRAGCSYLRLSERGTGKALDLVTLPVGVNFLLDVGSGRHFIEMGLGANYIYMGSTLNSFERETDFYLNPQAYLGYRYQSKDGHWTYRVAFTPFWGSSSLNDHRPNQQNFRITGLAGTSFQPWGCLGVGYRF